MVVGRILPSRPARCVDFALASDFSGGNLLLAMIVSVDGLGWAWRGVGSPAPGRLR